MYMEKVKLHDKVFRIMIPYEEIVAAIQKTADKINNDFRDCKEPPVLLCTLHGALPFTAELMKRLDFNMELTCARIKSYEGTDTTGTGKIYYFPTKSFVDRDVIVCEDIVDTGITAKEIRRMLAEAGAKSVKVASMLFKPDKYIARQGSLEGGPEYCSLTIGNEFIVGFGLDYDELGRNLKDIYVLSEE